MKLGYENPLDARRARRWRARQRRRRLIRRMLPAAMVVLAVAAGLAVKFTDRFSPPPPEDAPPVRPTKPVLYLQAKYPDGRVAYGYSFLPHSVRINGKPRIYDPAVLPPSFRVMIYSLPLGLDGVDGLSLNGKAVESITFSMTPFDRQKPGARNGRPAP